MKKSDLFCTEIDFLSHHILERGLEADHSKVEKILQWLVPRKAKHVQQFLGLVCYVAAFFSALAGHMLVLTLLTRKEFNGKFAPWTSSHQAAFEGIKFLVIGWDCLTTIDYKNPGNNKIFITCDASKKRTGAVLSFGETWEQARLVVFDSCQLTATEKNYPTHEHKLLVIV